MSYANLKANLAPGVIREAINTRATEPKLLTNLFPEKINKGAAMGNGSGYTHRSFRISPVNTLASPSSRTADPVECYLATGTETIVDLITTKEFFTLDPDEVNILNQMPSEGSTEYKVQQQTFDEVMQRIVNRGIAYDNYMKTQIIYNAGVIPSTTSQPLKFSVDFSLNTDLDATVAADAAYDWVSGTGPKPLRDLAARCKALNDVGSVPTDLVIDSYAFNVMMEAIKNVNSAVFTPTMYDMAMRDKDPILVLGGFKLRINFTDGAYRHPSTGTTTTYSSSTRVAVVSNPPGQPLGRLELGLCPVFEPAKAIGEVSWVEIVKNTRAELYTVRTTLAILHNPDGIAYLIYT